MPLLKNYCKPEHLIPFVPSLIPIPPKACRRDKGHWTRKLPRHRGCCETCYLLQYIYEKYCQVFQGRVKEMWGGVLVYSGNLNVPTNSHTWRCSCLAGVGHGGALQLAACGLSSKSFISTDDKGSMSPGGNRFLCFCYTVRGQRLLLKSSCWHHIVFWQRVLQYPPWYLSLGFKEHENSV